MVHLADCLYARDTVRAGLMPDTECIPALWRSGGSGNLLFTARLFRCIIRKN